MKFPIPALVAAAAATLAGNALAENPVVKMVTNHGEITIELDKENAPLSTENFLKYVKSGYYNKTVFHRVIDGFMIQGGGFAQVGDKIQQKETMEPIKNEAKNGVKNARGTLAMARTNNPHSATSQFFINVKDNNNLDYPSFDGWGYAVFGKVTGGMDVVDKIRAVPTTIRKLEARLPNGALYPNDFRDVPVKDVVIEKVTIAGEEAEAAPAEATTEEAGEDAGAATEGAAEGTTDAGASEE